MKNKLLRTALSLVTACLLVLAILPQRAEAAGASLSGSSSVQAGNSVTLTLSVDSKILGLTADLNCGDGLTFTNYSCSVSGWSILVNQNHFSVYGTNSASGGIITVTLKVSSSVQGGAALSASFSNIVASDGETDIDVGTASWTGSVAAAPSGDCTLSAIMCGNATLSPAFSSGTTYYTAKVPYSVSKLSLDYNRNDKGQTVNISGNDLAVGVNTVTLKVTAANGTTKSYVIEVTREQDPNYKASTDAALSALGIEGATLSPAFSSTVHDYVAYVPFETKTVKVNASANDSKSSGITGTGDITLDKEGDNPISVVCTAEDKTTKLEYTVHVVRMPEYTGTLPVISAAEPEPEPEPEPTPGNNLLINPGFEEWGEKLPIKWDNNYNIGEIVKEATIKHSGDYSLRQTSSSKTSKIQQEAEVLGGKKYRLSYWFLDNDAKASSRYWFALVDANGKTVNDLNAEIQQEEYSVDNPDWQQVKIEITMPENVVKVRFEIRTYRNMTTDEAGGYIYYDDMELIQLD